MCRNFQSQKSEYKIHFLNLGGVRRIILELSVEYMVCGKFL